MCYYDSKMMLLFIIFYFILFNVNDAKSFKADIKRHKRNLDWTQDGEENSAEYNFFDIAFAIIGRLLGGNYEKLADRFNDACYNQAYDEYGEGSSKKTRPYDFINEFPGAVRSIKWWKVNSKWTGDRDGYDSMVRSLPGIFESVLYSSGSVTKQELTTLLHYGVIAVSHREQLGRNGRGDYGHNQSLQRLRECVERIVNMVNDVLAAITGSSSNDHGHSELRRRGLSINIKKNSKSYYLYMYDNYKQHNSLGSIKMDSDEHSNCRNIQSGRKDELSSADTSGQCVIFYRWENCKGRNVVLLPGNKGHSNLVWKGFNDQAKSVRTC